MLRFANRVPLLYQAEVVQLPRQYKVSIGGYMALSRKEERNSSGPAIILIHVASTNIPFTSEAKEAIADITEIKKEIVLALRNNAKTLARHLKKQKKRAKVSEKFDLVQKYFLPLLKKHLVWLVNRTKFRQSSSCNYGCCLD